MMLKQIIKIFAFTALLSGLAYFQVNAADIYVDAQHGDDSAQGTAPSPFETIQRAAAAALPGDTVKVLSGVYYGPVQINCNGTAENPITFEAQGNVTITNADRYIRENPDCWQLEDESLGLYSAPLTLTADSGAQSNLFPTRVLSDEIDLLQYDSLDHLKSFVTTEDAQFYLDGYPHGYFYDGERIYVRLRADGKYGSPDPSEHIMKISPTYYTKTAQGTSNYGVCVATNSANIIVGNINEAANGDLPSAFVNITGFTLETPGLAGVYVRKSNVTIDNCIFRGCRVGVVGAPRYDTEQVRANNISVLRCDYTQYPTFDDAFEFIEATANNTVRHGAKTKYYWWHKKSPGDYGIPLYLRYEIGGIVGRMGNNWTIAENYIYNVFEGMSCYASESYKCIQNFNGVDASVIVGAENVTIRDNIFEKCLDNAVEFEEHLKGANVSGNTFKNNFLPISWQPLKGTPWPTNIKLCNNLIYNEADFNLVWFKKTRQPCRAFKIGSSTVSWDFTWMDKSELSADRVAVRIEENGVDIFNNTVIMPYGYLISYTISNSAGLESFRPEFKNMRFTNNIIVSHKKNAQDNDGESSIASGETALSDMGVVFADNVYAPDIPDINYPNSDITKNGIVLESADKIGFVKYTRLSGDFRLKSDSLFIGAGFRKEE